MWWKISAKFLRWEFYGKFHGGKSPRILDRLGPVLNGSCVGKPAQNPSPGLEVDLSCTCLGPVIFRSSKSYVGFFHITSNKPAFRPIWAMLFSRWSPDAPATSRLRIRNEEKKVYLRTLFIFLCSPLHPPIFGLLANFPENSRYSPFRPIWVKKQASRPS